MTMEKYILKEIQYIGDREALAEQSEDRGRAIMYKKFKAAYEEALHLVQAGVVTWGELGAVLGWVWPRMLEKDWEEEDEIRELVKDYNRCCSTEAAGGGG